MAGIIGQYRRQTSSQNHSIKLKKKLFSLFYIAFPYSEIPWFIGPFNERVLEYKCAVSGWAPWFLLLEEVYREIATRVSICAQFSASFSAVSWSILFYQSLSVFFILDKLHISFSMFSTDDFWRFLRVLILIWDHFQEKSNVYYWEIYSEYAMVLYMLFPWSTKCFPLFLLVNFLSLHMLRVQRS